MSLKFFSTNLKKQIIAIILVLSMAFVFVPQEADALVAVIIGAVTVGTIIADVVILCVVGVICDTGGGGGTGSTCEVENSCGMKAAGTITSSGTCSAEDEVPESACACTATNACGMISNGTLNTSGVCSATPIPLTSCTPVIGTFNFSPTTVWPNQSYGLTWNSTYANTCTASNAWSGTKSPSGSETVTAPNTSGTIRHSLTCYSAGSGGSTTRHRDITINEPELTINLSQSLLRKGDSTVVSWNITPDPRTEPNAACTITGVDGSPYDVTSGPTDSVNSGPVNNARRITLDCSIFGITYTEEILIGVVPTMFES